MAVPLTITFFCLPGEEDTVSQGLCGMMGEFGWQQDDATFAGCNGVHVAFGFWGLGACEISDIAAGQVGACVL
eukprot:14241617-Ditylum_brightwellii.AAC.1